MAAKTSLRRRQQTIGTTTRISGFGLFGGADVTIELCPADPNSGIVFERTDLQQPVRIPALIDFVVPRPRCTVISHQGASVAVIEHVMAALAGLRIDNCLVRIDAPEPPICDGSSLAFVEAIQSAGIIPQDALRQCVSISETLVVTEDDQVGIAVQSSPDDSYEIGFILDYDETLIPHQSLNVSITPRTFAQHLACCRTFALETEVAALRSQGLALRATPQNAVVFSSGGILENELRCPDECVRHKILDCVGDFALLGCDVIGRFTAMRSGHRLNHEIIRRIRAQMTRQRRHDFADRENSQTPTHFSQSRSLTLNHESV